MLTQLWQQPSSLRMFHAQAALGTAMKDSVAGHRDILAAIEESDHDLAIARVSEHIRGAQQETIVALGEHA